MQRQAVFPSPSLVGVEWQHELAVSVLQQGFRAVAHWHGVGFEAAHPQLVMAGDCAGIAVAMTSNVASFVICARENLILLPYPDKGGKVK